MPRNNTDVSLYIILSTNSALQPGKNSVGFHSFSWAEEAKQSVQSIKTDQDRYATWIVCILHITSYRSQLKLKTLSIE